MLQPKTEKEVSLIIKNVISACKDIKKLNSRGYDYLYIASGFIAHYSINGFKDYYTYNSLKQDILNNQNSNQWNNFRKGEKDYEYYHQKGIIYNAICEAIKNIKSSYTEIIQTYKTIEV